MDHRLQSRRAHCDSIGEGELAAGMISSDSSSGQAQDFELSHPYSYSMGDRLKYLKGLVLRIQNCRISTTQGNRIS